MQLSNQHFFIYQMTQEYYSRPADIARAASELFARKLIDKSTQDGLLSEKNRPNAKVDILLTALERKVTEDPQCAGEIKEVLERTGNCSLMKTLENQCEQLSPELSVDIVHPKGQSVKIYMTFTLLQCFFKTNVLLKV